MRHTKPQPDPLRTVPQPKPEPHPLAYCVEDVAKALGIGRTYVFHLIKEGQLRAVKIGRRTLVPVREVEAFLVRIGGGAA
jgi:excisionase family DNA binding protein